MNEEKLSKAFNPLLLTNLKSHIEINDQKIKNRKRTSFDLNKEKVERFSELCYSYGLANNKRGLNRTVEAAITMAIDALENAHKEGKQLQITMNFNTNTINYQQNNYLKIEQLPKAEQYDLSEGKQVLARLLLALQRGTPASSPFMKRLKKEYRAVLPVLDGFTKKVHDPELQELLSAAERALKQEAQVQLIKK
ncbi:MAG: hypothetical protein ACQCN3_02390 [Candidatus Bathyarchaeia archaeon]|jgi:hypothetical protein